MERSDTIVLSLVLLSVIAVIGSATWFFLVEKNYSFVVEAPCDPATGTCFVRDCSIEDECPPNELENYRIFRVRAGDFASCTDNSCLAECTAGTIQCTEQVCGDSEDDECSTGEEPAEESTTE